MINKIGIIGTGMIGASMAALFTGNSIPAVVLSLSDEDSKACMQRYNDCFSDLVKQGLVTEAQVNACSKLLTISKEYSALADVEMIIECVVEKLPVKHSVYKLIEENCPNVKAVASTTSAISAEDLAEGFTTKKDVLVGAHPWNPPHLVPCVELVKSKHTSDEAAKLAYDVLEYAGRKVVIMNKPAPGFVGNRLQHALYREAVYMIEQGIASPEDIDKTIQSSFGPRYTSIGIFEHFDYAGLDMVTSIEDYLFSDLCNATTTQDYVRSRLEAGDLGAKTGKGVYDWTKVDMKEFRERAAKPYYQFFNWNLPKV